MIAAETQLKTLMLAGLAGDAAAYRVLLQALTGHLRAYYMRRLGTGQRADAEDLVQETLIAMHTRRATYDTAQPFTAWVHAIARYKLIDHLRRSKLRRTLPLDDAEAVFAEDGHENANARGDLENLLETLPQRSRDLIRQIKLEGFSAAEAAARSGMSESAVKVGVHRGLKALAARIRGSQS